MMFKGVISALIECASGVSQGSNLGTLLFAIFINDITLKIESSDILLYADDMKIYKEIRTEQDAVVLQALEKWREENNSKF